MARGYDLSQLAENVSAKLIIHLSSFPYSEQVFGGHDKEHHAHEDSDCGVGDCLVWKPKQVTPSFDKTWNENKRSKIQKDDIEGIIEMIQYSQRHQNRFWSTIEHKST